MSVYDKPKVTIDLDEYLALKENKPEVIERLRVGCVVGISCYNNPPDLYNVEHFQDNGDIKTYYLKPQEHGIALKFTIVN